MTHKPLLVPALAVVITSALVCCLQSLSSFMISGKAVFLVNAAVFFIIASALCVAVLARFRDGFAWLLSVLCFAMLLLPSIQLIGGLFPEPDAYENRKLSPPPSFGGCEGVAFFKAFQNYFNDHFGLRRLLIDIKNKIDVNGFNVSPSPILAMGKSGWIFYRPELASPQNNINVFDDLQGLVRFSNVELLKIKKNVESFAKKCEKRGICFIIGIAPNKETMYTEFLPAYVETKNKKTRLDQLTEYFKAHSSVEILDFRQTLLRNKKTLPLYYWRGTHWNSYGAFYAYQDFIKKLSLCSCAVESFELDDFEVTVAQRSAKDHWFKWNEHTDYTFKLKKGTSTEGKIFNGTCLFMHDSFGHALLPFVKKHFTAVFPLAVAGTEGLTYSFEAIDQNTPDVILFIIVERNLHRLMWDVQTQ